MPGGKSHNRLQVSQPCFLLHKQACRVRASTCSSSCPISWRRFATHSLNRCPADKSTFGSSFILFLFREWGFATRKGSQGPAKRRMAKGIRSRFCFSSGTKNEHKPKLLSPDIFRWASVTFELIWGRINFCELLCS